MKRSRFNLVALPGIWLLGMAAAAGAPANSIGEAAFLSHVRQLTYEGRRSGEGYFSPDGRRLIFQSERESDNPFYQIYILNLVSGDCHRVSPGPGKTTCAFFRPRSDEVLFASTHLDPEVKAKQKAELEFRAAGKQRRYTWDYDEHMDIFSSRQDGSGLKRLTEAPGYDAEAAYSPDGRSIVFCSLRDAYPTNKLSAAELKQLEADPAYFGEIYLMNADGSGPQRLTRTPGYDGGPFFSPDGKRIIWRRFDTNGIVADIYTMKLDGSDMRRLTDFRSMSWAPYFHPSGKNVIFASNQQGFSNFELFLVDAAGEREPLRVTYTDGFDGLPVFSPDGRRLCWTSNRTPDGKSQLFLADWNQEAALTALRAAPARGNPAVARAPAKPAITVLPALRKTTLSAEITAADLRHHIEYLASDALEGRMTGAKGAQLAANYIADELRRAGLQPLNGDTTFFQDFEFNSGVRVVTNDNRLSFSPGSTAQADQAFDLETDFRPLSFTANGDVEGEVVFAGYGLVVPGKPGAGYDSYAGLNVSNRIVLALRYVPEEVEPQRRQELNRYAGLRYKAMMAREHGAKAMLVVTGPNSPNAGALVPLSFDSSLSGSGIIAASIRSNLADVLLQSSGKTLKALQSALDKEGPHAEGGFVVPNLKVRIATAVEHLKKKDRNVLALLPASGRVVPNAPRVGTRPSAGGPVTALPPEEYVMLGAHYDHLGFGEAGAMQHAGEENQIHNGADDNASGVAVLLEMAAALARDRVTHPLSAQRGIVLALWSGEELGLIGSSYFAEHPPVPLSNIVAYLNFDMVGRLRDNRLILQGVGSSTVWRRLAERHDLAAGFNLVLQDDPYLPTDVTAIYPKLVPVLNFFTGSHEDYHRPTDDADKLNYADMERIGRFARDIVLELANSPARMDYARVARSDRDGGSRENLRAYLGTIPDYATEVAGVKLSGVRAGSPAEKAGLKGGDIIVEFAGRKITNIYDYTYALDAVKIGQPMELVVLRDGKRVTLSVVPEARK